MTVAVAIFGVFLLIMAIIAVRDLTQKEHAVTRNFPVVGHFRYFFEELGQPMRQYFFSGDLDERPYNRVTRSWVYASAKGQNNAVGFGSQVDHHEPGRMHILPSMYPTLSDPTQGLAGLPQPRVIGSKRAEPLSADPLRQHFWHELRRALAQRGPRSLSRRPAGTLLHEHRRRLVIAVPH